MNKHQNKISNLSNSRLDQEIGHIAEVAGYLWQREWAEANGGNISVNLTHLADSEILDKPATSAGAELGEQVSALAGNIFYVTGAGQRLRDVAKSPLDFGALIRITDDGKRIEIISEKVVKPTSELISHLCIHNFLKTKGNEKSVVLHTHPIELIALTHCKPFLDPVLLTRTLWSMTPETRVLAWKGVGVVPYVLTGTKELAKATISELEKHDVVLWEKHGALAVGDDIVNCFDLIDTLNKAAKIYLAARMAGFEPEGLSREQMNELAEAFGLPTEE